MSNQIKNEKVTKPYFWAKNAFVTFCNLIFGLMSCTRVYVGTNPKTWLQKVTSYKCIMVIWIVWIVTIVMIEREDR